MQTTRIAIIGGDLSGLYAAFLVERAGVQDYVVLEARERLGGRVVSVPRAEVQPDAVHDDCDRLDLGPSWFWPEFQPRLDALIRDLGLERFQQFAAGDMLVEHSRDEPPMHLPDSADIPVSMHLKGGMRALVDALQQRLDGTRVRCNRTVRALHATGTQVVLDSRTAQDEVEHWCAEHVLLAVPPRLAEATVPFTPAVPQPLARQWSGTPTWMAPHAKYLALYETPFWRARAFRLRPERLRPAG